MCASVLQQPAGPSSLLTTNMDIPSEAEIAELDHNVEETIEPRFLMPSSAAAECPSPPGQSPGQGQPGSEGSQPDSRAAFVHLTPGQRAAAAMAAEVESVGVDGFVSDAHQQAAHASAAAVAAATPIAVRVRLDAFWLPGPAFAAVLTTAVAKAATDVATARVDLLHAQNRLSYDREAEAPACCPLSQQHALQQAATAVEPRCRRQTPSRAVHPPA